MDEFTYHNIFDTKGLEYLVIIAFLVLLIPFWLFLNRKMILQRKNANRTPLAISSLRMPPGLFYGKNHTWAFLERTGIAKIGLNDLLVKLTGTVGVMPLRAPGEIVRKGEVIACIGTKDKSLKILSPISGKIVEGNESVFHDPAILSTDPYGKGWIYSIRPEDWLTETRSTYFAETVNNWMEKELNRLKDFLAENGTRNMDRSHVVMQDGGEVTTHVLETLPEDLWKNFEEEFLGL